jgi:fucose permease
MSSLKATSTQPARMNQAFIYVTSLFFAWGFITATLDTLVPLVKSVFTLSYSESLLTQFAFFLAYGIVSLPASSLVARLGSAASIIIALVTMVVGCLIFPVATSLRAYPLILVALFVLGSGITLLQVAANPLAAALGKPEKSHMRLVLSQAFNSFGTTIAPYIGARLLLSGGVFGGNQDEAALAESLHKVDTDRRRGPGPADLRPVAGAVLPDRRLAGRRRGAPFAVRGAEVALGGRRRPGHLPLCRRRSVGGQPGHQLPGPDPRHPA